MASDLQVAAEETATDAPTTVAGQEVSTDAGQQTPGLPQAGSTPTVPGGGQAADLEGPALEEYLARRYEAYWDAYDAARSAPTANPSTDFPILGNLAAGEQLEVSYQTLIELSEKGEAIREPDTPAIDGIDSNSEHRVRIDLIDGTVAEISGCVVNDDVRHVVDSGAVVRESVATVMSASTMALTDGEWKLIRSRAVDIADGVTGCWLTDDSEFPF